MPFTDAQTGELKKPLDRSQVKTRTQSGQTLSYIEGWHAIAEANRIFGFDGWHRETIGLTCVQEPEQVNGTWRVGYIAKVRIQVAEVVREGTGFGSGAAKDKGGAIESAVKEAETDAMKRALMTFGNPFGLALYDKTQSNVCDIAAQDKAEQQITYAQNFRLSLANATKADEIRHLWQTDKQLREELGIGVASKLAGELHSEWLARGKELSQKEKQHEQAA